MTYLSLLYVASMQVAASQFEVALWPGEGRPVFEAVATEVVLRELPSPDAKVVERLRIARGKPVEFGETVHRTLASGYLRALRQTRIRGRRLGDIKRLSKDDYYSGKFPRTEVVVEAGARVEYLQYRAEGTCFVRIEGEVVDAEACPAEDAHAFALESKPALEWWIEVVVDGKPRGWLLVDSSTVKQVRRTF
jgi:hypothetical protein